MPNEENERKQLMMTSKNKKILYSEIGVCGLSCRLCPNYHIGSINRCLGCKSDGRMAVGCPFITCAVKKKEIEFCWECNESTLCEKWRKHRENGKKYDSFKCYQTLEKDITFIQEHGIEAFVKDQKIREQLLREMLELFNEGRSKSYFCIAATILDIDELRKAVETAKQQINGMDIKNRSKVLHAIVDEIAKSKGYYLKLRKH